MKLTKNKNKIYKIKKKINKNQNKTWMKLQLKYQVSHKILDILNPKTKFKSLKPRKLKPECKLK